MNGLTGVPQEAIFNGTHMAHTVSDFVILGSVRAASTNTPRETWNAGSTTVGQTFRLGYTM